MSTYESTAMEETRSLPDPGMSLGTTLHVEIESGKLHRGFVVMVDLPPVVLHQ